MTNQNQAIPNNKETVKQNENVLNGTSEVTTEPRTLTIDVVYNLDTIDIRFINTVNIPETKVPNGKNYVTFLIKSIEGIVAHGERSMCGNEYYYIIFANAKVATAGTRRINLLNKDIFEFKKVDKERYLAVIKIFNLGMNNNNTTKTLPRGQLSSQQQKNGKASWQPDNKYNYRTLPQQAKVMN